MAEVFGQILTVSKERMMEIQKMVSDTIGNAHSWEDELNQDVFNARLSELQKNDMEKLKTTHEGIVYGFAFSDAVWNIRCRMFGWTT